MTDYRRVSGILTNDRLPTGIGYPYQWPITDGYRVSYDWYRRVSYDRYQRVSGILWPIPTGIGYSLDTFKVSARLDPLSTQMIEIYKSDMKIMMKVDMNSISMSAYMKRERHVNTWYV